MSGKRKTTHSTDVSEEELETPLYKKWKEIPEDIMIDFIRAIELNECLWNKSTKLYKNVPFKDSIFSELEEKFRMEVGVASSTLKWLKQAYSASVSRENLPSGSGCPSPKRKKEFIYKEHLMFMKKAVPQKNKRITSFIAVSDDEEEDWGSENSDEVAVDVLPIKRELSEGTKQTLAHIGPIRAGTSKEAFVMTSRAKKKQKTASLEDLLSENSQQIDNVMKSIHSPASSNSPHLDIHSKLDQCLSKIPPQFIDDFKVDVYSSLTSLTKKYCDPTPTMHPLPSYTPHFPYSFPQYGAYPFNGPPVINQMHTPHPPPNQSHPPNQPPANNIYPLNYLP